MQWDHVIGKKVCDKVKTIEEAYVKSDHVIDKMTEEFIIRVGDSDSSDSELDSSTNIEDEIATPGPSSGIPLGNYIEGVMPMSESD
ncbi:unnamed protein product [Parnassius apollo]|uniref:(apollo) hypothetical protein n=1 Tax=Parnassius apollo TaxID=110799 RepID=A0A8S3W2I3_PARAO|nr:unnamed protein product [Parnassius apollo]